MEGLKLPFYSSTPGVLGLPSCTLPFWCPVKGCAGDVAWLSSHHCHRHMMMVTMLSWLQRARRCWLEMVPGQNIRKVLGVEGRHCWVCFQSSSSILRHRVGWKVLSYGTVLVWSWCCTRMTSTHCLAFWRHSWPCWGDSWCHCLLCRHAWRDSATEVGD